MCCDLNVSLNIGTALSKCDVNRLHHCCFSPILRGLPFITQPNMGEESCNFIWLIYNQVSLVSQSCLVVQYRTCNKKAFLSKANRPLANRCLGYMVNEFEYVLGRESPGELVTVVVAWTPPPAPMNRQTDRQH